MPYRVVNTFRPMTPWGEGLQNITQALFSGPTPADMEKQAATTDLHRAQIDHYRAQTDQIRAKASADQRAQADMADAPAQIGRYIFQDQPTADAYDKFKRGVPTETAFPAGLEEPPEVTSRPPVKPVVMPAQEAQYNTLMQGIHAARANPGNDNLGNILKALTQVGAFNDVRGGAKALPVAQATVASGLSNHNIFSQDAEGSVLNTIEGSVDQSNPLARAHEALTGEKSKTEKAHQGAFGAAAGRDSAHAKLFGAQTEDVNTSRAMIPALTPDGKQILGSDGKPVLIQRKELGGIIARGAANVARDDNKALNTAAADELKPPRGASVGKVRPVTKPDQVGIAAQFDSIMQNEFNLDSVDAGTKGAILAAAGDEWQNGAKDYGSAVREALRKVAPDGFEDTRAGIPLVPSRNVAKGGVRAQTKPITTAPAGAPAARSGLPAPKSQAEYDALPVGAQYMGTDGVPKVKKAKRNADGSVGS